MLAVPGVEWTYRKGLLQGWGQTRRRGPREFSLSRTLGWLGTWIPYAASGRGRVTGLSGLLGLKSKSQRAVCRYMSKGQY